jgi:hypothetical protein
MDCRTVDVDDAVMDVLAAELYVELFLKVVDGSFGQLSRNAVDVELFGRAAFEW